MKGILPIMVLAIVLIAAGFFLLFIPFIQGEGSVDIPGIPGVTQKKFIVCDITVDEPLIGDTDLKGFECARGNTCLGTVGSLFGGSGKLRMTSLPSGTQASMTFDTELFDREQTVQMKVCAPFDDNRVRVDVLDESFTVVDSLQREVME